MSRIEHIGDATLYLGNCREIAQGLTADAVISDPPYGNRRQGRLALDDRGAA